MNLLLDCGNTMAKFAWCENGLRQPAKALSYKQLNELKQHLQYTPTKIFGAIVASTATKLALEQACMHAWGLKINWCDTSIGTHLIHSNYAHTLGADRWFGMLGLLNAIKQQSHWQAGYPYILASFGTATTIDTIRLQNLADGSKQACFLGGLILPGAQLMLQSLAQGTAQLPLAHGHIADFPQDTDTAINSGVAAAQSGALLRQWKRASLLGPQLHPQIYVCGGAWPAISTHVLQELAHAQAAIGFPDQPSKWLESPVLDGLALVNNDRTDI